MCLFLSAFSSSLKVHEYFSLLSINFLIQLAQNILVVAVAIAAVKWTFSHITVISLYKTTPSKLTEVPLATFATE